MAGDEERCGSICSEVLGLSAGEGRSMEASWFVAAVTHSGVKMGACYHGIRDVFSQESEGS